MQDSIRGIIACWSGGKENHKRVRCSGDTCHAGAALGDQLSAVYAAKPGRKQAQVLIVLDLPPLADMRGGQPAAARDTPAGRKLYFWDTNPVFVTY